MADADDKGPEITAAEEDGGAGRDSTCTALSTQSFYSEDGDAPGPSAKPKDSDGEGEVSPAGDNQPEIPEDGAPVQSDTLNPSDLRDISPSPSQESSLSASSPAGKIKTKVKGILQRVVPQKRSKTGLGEDSAPTSEAENEQSESASRIDTPALPTLSPPPFSPPPLAPAPPLAPPPPPPSKKEALTKLFSRKKKDEVKGDVSPEEQGERIGEDAPAPEQARPAGLQRRQKRFRIIMGIFIVIVAIALGFYFLTNNANAIDIRTMEKQAQEWRPGNCISILVTGRLSTGKHDLIRSLLGQKPKCSKKTPSTPIHAPVCDINVQGICFKVTFWTLPDMADSDYWKAIEGELRSLDLVIYALKMDDPRLRPEDVSNLHTLSREFGDALWTKGMFALTFANKVTYLDGTHHVQRSKEFSTKRSSELKHRIQEVLLQEGVSDAVSNSIPYVPAGHYAEPRLFGDDSEPWINQLVKCAIIKMNTTGNGASGAVWKATKHRLELNEYSTMISCSLMQ